MRESRTCCNSANQMYLFAQSCVLRYFGIDHLAFTSLAPHVPSKAETSPSDAFPLRLIPLYYHANQFPICHAATPTLQRPAVSLTLSCPRRSRPPIFSPTGRDLDPRLGVYCSVCNDCCFTSPTARIVWVRPRWREYRQIRLIMRHTDTLSKSKMLCAQTPPSVPQRSLCRSKSRRFPPNLSFRPSSQVILLRVIRSHCVAKR